MRNQLPEWFSVETGEGKGNAAGLAQRDNAPPVEVEQFVQLQQIAGDVDKRRVDHSAMHQVQHRQQQDRLMRGLAFGGFSPDRAGGAVEGGEVGDGGGQFSH